MKKKAVIASLLILLFLVSCRGVVESRDPALQLRERVEGFIEARNKGDLTLLQSYFVNPGKARISTFTYVDSEITAIEMGEGKKSAEVKINNTIKVMGFIFKGLPQTLQWEWHNNDWFYSFADKPVNPFANPKK